MSEPFVGEIRMFAGSFAPRGWAFCDGQLLAVSQNDALFSLLGTVYGGDGRTTFGLPDARGRLPIHAGVGLGLRNRPLGSKGGEESVTVLQSQLPQHTHEFNASTITATATSPTGAALAVGVGVNSLSETVQHTDMASTMFASSGDTRSHSNLMPALCVNFIISLFGIYPSRT